MEQSWTELNGAERSWTKLNGPELNVLNDDLQYRYLHGPTIRTFPIRWHIAYIINQNRGYFSIDIKLSNIAYSNVQQSCANAIYWLLLHFSLCSSICISIDLTSNKDENIAIVTWLKGTDPFPKHHNIIHRMNAEPYQNIDIILILLMWHIDNNQWSALIQCTYIFFVLLFRETIQRIVIFKSLPTM